MSRKNENSGFICQNCGRQVAALSNGSYRNHCPHCLYSLHVDIVPGDRSSDCGGLMRPVQLVTHSKKGLQAIHRCEKCGAERANRVARDTDMPDDFDLIVRLLRCGTTKKSRM